jgi:RNA polymerase sigma factor (sigma-70 family)
MILSDQDFARLKQRDGDVLTRIYDSYAEKVATFLYVRTFGNHAAADDLTQETFCGFIGYAPRIKSGERVQQTLFAIARNKLADYQRRACREKKTNEPLGECEDPRNDVVAEIDRRQRSLLFSLALEKLGERDREVYEMHYVEEKEIAEIAAHFGATYKSIDGILCRLREKLKREMTRISRDFFPEERPR